MIKKYFFVLLFTFSLSTIFFSQEAQAQEICNNGIDDDGDNLVDGYDPDCPCDDNALLCQPSCEFSIPGGPLNFQQKWTSTANVPIYMTPLSGDVNGDGVPDIVILSSNSLVTSDPRRAKDILIINGATGVTTTTITTPFVAWVGPSQIAIADVDNDGFGEIFVAAMDHSSNPVADRRFLFCYSHTGALKWKSDLPFGFATGTAFGGSLGIADFNADGIPEVYIYNTIFNARTGRKLCDGGAANPKGIMTNQGWGNASTTMAADLLPNPGLELAAGNAVYTVSITNTAGIAGNTMTPVIFPGRADGFTSVADINLDGFLDVVVATAGNPAELYVWNPRNTPSLIANRSLPNTGSNGWTGPPFIGDIDNDCTPEIGVTRASRVYALKFNGTTTLQQKWALTTSDVSGFTGITMFDFNQDGTQEIVYRDETTLRILNGSGTAPVVVGTQPCSSGTGAEMPIVADVDGDGQADICVTCATSNPSVGKVNVFRSSGAAWAPSRSVWNQYNYNFVNVNNNLRIPIQPQPPQALISTVFCPFSSCNANRPFNSFLTQVTLLTQDGCPVYPATDLSVAIQGTPTCNGSNQLTFNVIVTNTGQAASNPGFPIQFYAGNPLTNASAIRLTSSPAAVFTQTAIQPNQSEIITVTLDIGPIPKPFNLFVIFNDDGTETLPLTFPASSIAECGFANNVVSLNNVDCCSFGDLAITNFNPLTPTFCAGNSSNITVAATSSAGMTNATYQWTTPSNGSLTGTTIVANQNGTYQVIVTDDAFCTVTGSITANQIPLPSQANAGIDQTVCSSTAALSGNTPNVGTGSWSVLSGGGSVTNPTQANSGVSNLQIGINQFIWTVTNGGICVSSDTVVISRLAPPTLADAGPVQSVCATSATLAGNVPSIGTGTWTVVSGSGTFVNANSPTSAVNGLAVGANVFQWTISNGICPVSSSQVTITRSQNPTTSNAGINQNICGPDAILSANLPVIGTGQWTVVSGTGNFSNPNSPNILVFGLSEGANVFSWTISNGACPPSSSSVTVTRISTPTIANAGTNQTICTSSTTMLANAPNVGFGQWAIVSGNAVIVDSTSPSTAITNIPIGTVTLRWSIINFPCPTSFSDITITRIEEPTLSNAGPNQDVCADNATLAANTPTVGTGEWTIVSGTGTFVDNTSPTSNVSNLGFGTNVFRWTISNGICTPSSSDVTIIRNEEPTPVNAGTSLSICNSSASLNAAVPTIGTGQWSVISGGATIANTNAANSAVSNLSFGANVFRWTVTNGACVLTSDVTITRDEPPSNANAGLDQSLCGSSTALSANTPTIGTGTWTVVSGAGDFNDINNPTTSVSNLSVGNNVFRWTISNGTCPSQSDEVAILVSANPVNINAGPDQTICVDNTSLAATSSGAGVGTWTVISGSGTFSNANSNTTNLSNLDFGANVFRWTVVTGACEVFAELTVNRDTPPTPSNAGANETICANQTILNANLPTVGNGTWALISGTATIDDVNNASSNLSGIGIGQTVLSWTISNGVCPSSTSNVTIDRIENPTVSSAGQNQTICIDNATLSANIPTVGTGQWTLVSGTGLITNTSDANTTVTGLGFDANVFRWTISNGICPPSTADVIITRLQEPSPADAGSDIEVCLTTATLNAVAPSVGTGTWSIVTGNGIFSDINNPNATVSNLDAGINVFQWTISNGVCTTNSDQVVVTRNKFTFDVNAGPNQQICVDNTVLAAVNPAPATGTWSVISGTGTISDINTFNSAVNNIGVGSLVLEWTVSIGSCLPVTSQVTIERFAEPSVANAGIDQTLCADVANLNAEIPNIGTGQWTVSVGTAIITDATNAQSQVSNLSVGENTFNWTISNGPCATTIDAVSIFRDELPTGVSAGSDQTVCVDLAALSAIAGSVGTGTWSLVSGTGVFAGASNANTNVTGLSVGSNVFEWKVSNGTCEVTDLVTIIRSAEPTIANAGADQTICADNIILTGNSALVGISSWQLVSGSGTINILNDSTIQVNGLSEGAQTFEYSISSPGCIPSTDQVTVTRDQAPTQANAGGDITICDDIIQLAANIPVNGIGNWAVIAGSATISNAGQNDAFANNLSGGLNQFVWSITLNNTCPSSNDTLDIIRDLPPTTSDAGVDQTICGTATNLSANIPLVGLGTWSVIQGQGNFLDANSPITPVSGLMSGLNEFEWRITNGVCLPTVDFVEVNATLPINANAGLDQTLCIDNATMAAVLPTGTTGTWELVSGAGVIADVNNPTTSITGLAEGVNTFRWIVELSGCPPDTAVVNLNFTCNEIPILFNEIYTLDQGTSVTGNVLDNGDFDPDGTNLDVNVNPIVNASNGTFIIDVNGNFTYTPNPTYFGNDTVVVQICDNGIPLPPACALDTIVFIINEVNFPPVIVNDSVSTEQDSTVTGNVNTNNSDPEGQTLTADTTPVSGPSNGTITIDADGSFTYTPNAGFIGNDTIVINICDAGTPPLCGLDTLVISVTEPLPNQPPVIVNDSVSTEQDSTVTGNVNTNNSDPEGQTLTADTTPVSGPSNGNITIDADGSFTYTPNAGFLGNDTIVISICDAGTPPLCGLDTLVISVTEPLPNQPPVIVNDSVSTEQDSTVTGNVNTNNSDPEGQTLTADTTPVSGPSNGNITIDADGSFTYTPNAGFIGNDTIVINICDAGIPPLCGLDTLVISVTEPLPNQPPMIVNDSVSTEQDSTVTGNVNTNNSDPEGQTLTADTTPVSGPSNGNITIGADGSFTYTPNTGFIGSDTIVINICDAGTPPLCGLDTLVISVTEPLPNQPPLIVNDSVSNEQDSTVTGNVNTNNSDPEGQTLTADTTPVSGPSNGTITIDADGSFTYTPNAGFIGNDTIVINICDAGTPPLCGLDTLVISVTETPPVNEPPVTVNEQIVLDEDNSFTGNMLDNGDVDPEGGVLTVDTNSVVGPNNGTFVVDSLGNFTYSPAPNFNGQDTVIVQVCDDGNPIACSPDTLVFTVNPVNDAPIVVNENISINNNETATGNILDNDSDIDISALTVTELLQDAINGSFVFDSTGAFTYTPDSCFVGTDTVIVLVCDSGIPLPALCANDTLFFTVSSPEIIANAGPDQTICGTNTILSAVEATEGATGVWSILTGEANITNLNDPESIVNGLANGENLLVWTVSYCDVVVADTVSITSNPLPSIPFAGEDQNVCGTEFTLQANTPSEGTGVWAQLFVSNAAIADVNANITTVSVPEQGLTYQFSWTITLGNCSLTDTVVVNALIVPEPSILSDEQTVCINNPITLAASSAFGTANTWSALTNGGTLSSTTDSVITYTSSTVGENFIQLTVSLGPCSTTVVDTITVLSASESACQSGVFIPEGFSPNNDGANDLFVIRGADGRRIQVMIFNRWGVLVYESENYQNDWDGRAYKGLMIDNQFLPESTYYYVIKIGPGTNVGEEEFKGYTTLWR